MIEIKLCMLFLKNIKQSKVNFNLDPCFYRFYNSEYPLEYLILEQVLLYLKGQCTFYEAQAFQAL